MQMSPIAQQSDLSVSIFRRLASAVMIIIIKHHGDCWNNQDNAMIIIKFESQDIQNQNPEIQIGFSK